MAFLIFFFLVLLGLAMRSFHSQRFATHVPIRIYTRFLQHSTRLEPRMYFQQKKNSRVRISFPQRDIIKWKLIILDKSANPFDAQTIEARIRRKKNEYKLAAQIVHSHTATNYIK